MILLFGDKAKSSATKKNNNVRNNPVENSGILAMSPSQAKSLLSMGEYDTYLFSNPAVVDYAMYANYEGADVASVGFMSDFSAAVATLGDCGGFSAGGFDCGGGFSSGASCGSSCSSFSSVG